RVSSSINNANFTTDGVDAAVRNLPVDAAQDEALVVEKLIDLSLVPACSPALVEKHGPLTSPDMLKGVPLIHDDSLSGRAAMPTWADWFAAAGVRDADVSRGLRFNSADHALDATVEGAGVLLAHDVLAYDDLRTGRLVMPFDLSLPSGRCYCFVCPKKRRESANVRVFRAWLKEEAAALDWSKCARSRRGGGWNWVGVDSGLLNPNDSGAGALERRPRHDEGYHEGGGCGCRGFAFR